MRGPTGWNRGGAVADFESATVLTRAGVLAGTLAGEGHARSAQEFGRAWEAPEQPDAHYPGLHQGQPDHGGGLILVGDLGECRTLQDRGGTTDLADGHGL